MTVAKKVGAIALALAICLGVSSLVAAAPVASVIKGDTAGASGFPLAPARTYEVVAGAPPPAAGTAGDLTFPTLLAALTYVNAMADGIVTEISLQNDDHSFYQTATGSTYWSLTNVILNGNGHKIYSLVPEYGTNVTKDAFPRAFEFDNVHNMEFKDIVFTALPGKVFGDGIWFDNPAGKSSANIFFDNVTVNLDINLNGTINTTYGNQELLLFYCTSDVTFHDLDLSGSTIVPYDDNSAIAFYGPDSNFDFGNFTAAQMPVGADGIYLVNYTSSLADEPRDIRLAGFPCLVTFYGTNSSGDYHHITNAYPVLSEALAYADSNPTYPGSGYPLDCIMDLNAQSFILTPGTGGASFLNMIRFIHFTDHGPDHAAAVTDPADKAVGAGASGSSAFAVTDSDGNPVTIDFSRVAAGTDYTLTSSVPSVVDPASLSVGDTDNTIAFTGLASGVSTISLLPAGSTVPFVSFTVTVVQTYTVAYHGNGSTGGSVPTDPNVYAENDSVTVLGNVGLSANGSSPDPLTKDGNTFLGWSTDPNATAAEYAAGGTFIMPGHDVILYAVWTTIPLTGFSGALLPGLWISGVSLLLLGGLWTVRRKRKRIVNKHSLK